MGQQLVGIGGAGVANVIIAVGPRGKLIGGAAREEERAEVIYAAGNSEAIAEIGRVTQPGDIVLIKGSRGAQMEDGVQAVAEDTEGHGGAPGSGQHDNGLFAGRRDGPGWWGRRRGACREGQQGWGGR